MKIELLRHVITDMAIDENECQSLHPLGCMMTHSLTISSRGDA